MSAPFAVIHEAVSDSMLRKILALADRVQEHKEYVAAERQRKIQQLREERRIREGGKVERFHQRRAS